MTTAILDAATPDRSVATPPPALRLMEPQEHESASEISSEPFSDLIQARALADQHPASAIVQARFAQALLAYGRGAEAVRVAAKAALLGRDTDPDAVIAASIVLLAAGRIPQAESALGRQATPTARFLFGVCAVNRRDYDKALARLADLGTYEAQSLCGWIHLQRHDFTSAVRSLRHALELGEPTSDVMANLAFAHASLGHRKSALQCAVTAVGLAPADKLASLNLLSNRLASRDFAGVKRELDRAKVYRPGDLSIPIFEALVRRETGDARGCSRMLRSLKSDKRYWAATGADRSELKMHLAILDYVEGRAKRAETRVALTRALEESDYQNLQIAQCLIALYVLRSDAPFVRGLLKTLSKHHGKERLFGIEAHAAFLEFDFEVALMFAKEWLRVEPLNPAAASTLTYLLIDAKHDFAEAIRVGMDFLARIDDRGVVLNNTAYALVMDNQLAAARKLLSVAADSPVVLATRGLLSIRMGEAKEGIALYDDAERLARNSGDPELAGLLKVRKAMALGAPNSVELDTDDASPDDPRLALTYGAESTTAQSS